MAKKSDKRRRGTRRNMTHDRRPAPRPTPDYEDDMFSEFSDDTNTFYTDEQAEREEREMVEERAVRGKKAQRESVKKQERRKPMSPTRRKIIRILSYSAIISVVLIVGVVLSLTVLFKTQEYNVIGNTRYDEQEIIDASGISKGENIFLAPKKQAEKKIKKAFPYVEDVSVGFTIPDTIKITIEEAIEGYLIKQSDSGYLVISTKGRILDRATDASAYHLPIFIGPTLSSGEIGDYVSYEDSKVVDMIESITQTFADNGYNGITEIDATNMADISFTYQDRVKVRLGIPEDLDYKIRTAMTIITDNLDKNSAVEARGVLDVSRCNTTKRSYYNEQEIRPTEKTTPTVTPTTTTQSGDTGEETYDYDGYSYEGEGNYGYYTGEEYYDGGWYDGDGYYE